MKNFIKLLSCSLILFSANHINSQCETWHGLEESEQLLNSYVLYRDYLKKGEFQKAFPYWEYVYKNAPAADGKRSQVYPDGRTLYSEKFKLEKNKKKKTEIVDFIFQLLEEEKKCYLNSDIIEPPKEIIEFRSEI